MKKFLLYIGVIAVIVSCSSEQTITVTVENPSDFDRSDEIVEISTDNLANIELKENQTYTVKNENGEIVPIQITYDGYLIFQSGTNAKETKVYTITAGEPQSFPSKSYGRFIPERKEDFAWENDRVAFRVYGNALIETDGPSNGIDIWYKRTNDLIIDKWYKDDIAGVRSYHEDDGEGLDDYKVGRTLGAGMMAPFVNDQLWLNENFIQQELYEQGPLRTTFKLTYKDIEVDGKIFSESRTFSLNAGSQLTKITQVYGTTEPIAVAAGIVKREESNYIAQETTEKGTTTIVYAEPTSPKAGNIYVGMIVPFEVEDVITDTYTITNSKTKKPETHSHILAATTYQPNNPITYYIGYGWEKFGFPKVGDFQTYIINYAARLEQPLIVNVQLNQK